jgi:pyridoxal phosphate enzyme (YggS family)
MKASSLMVLPFCFNSVVVGYMQEAFGYQTLRERFESVRQKVVQAAQRSNRSADEITVIAISKSHPTEKLRAAIDAGIQDLGENRIQEAEPKIHEIGRTTARWHLVGHLQANKARKAVQLFDYIHSLDSVDLARRLDRLCAEQDRFELPVLIQIDLGGEETKTGIEPTRLPELLEMISRCSRLRLAGLMTMPPYFEDPDCARPFFKALRDVRDQLQRQGSFGDRRGELSMGMSNDFEVAVEEGATMVRVGTAIFGARSRESGV